MAAFKKNMIIYLSLISFIALFLFTPCDSYGKGGRSANKKIMAKPAPKVEPGNILLLKGPIFS